MRRCGRRADDVHLGLHTPPPVAAQQGAVETLLVQSRHELIGRSEEVSVQLPADCVRACAGGSFDTRCHVHGRCGDCDRDCIQRHAGTGGNRRLDLGMRTVAKVDDVAVEVERHRDREAG